MGEAESTGTIERQGNPTAHTRGTRTRMDTHSLSTHDSCSDCDERSHDGWGGVSGVCGTCVALCCHKKKKNEHFTVAQES